MADEYVSKRAVCYQLDKRATIDGQPRAIRRAMRIVQEFPAADVALVRHGRWNEESPEALDGDSVYVCSVCGETWTLIEGTPLDNNMHYCPNCGARMDGGNDAED